MQRATLIGVFAASLLVMAVSAVPASALFESDSNRNQGVLSTGATVLTQASGSAVGCSKAEGGWKIRSTGKLTEQTSGPGQQPTKIGPHQDITISKWNNCSAGGVAPAFVEPCELQVEQLGKGVTTGTGSVASTCKVKIPLSTTGSKACEILVGTTSNERLKSVTFANSGEASTISTAAIEGLTNTINSTGGGCTEIGVVAEGNNKFKGAVTAVGEKLV